MVSGLMNWKQRRTEFFSGTWNILPRISISTRRSKGRKGSPIFSVRLESTPRLLCVAGLKEGFSLVPAEPFTGHKNRLGHIVAPNHHGTEVRERINTGCALDAGGR